MTIVPASSDDLGAIRQLLQEADLPYTDLTHHHMTNYLVARKNNHGIAAIVGMEIFGEDAMLRSLVVAQEHRGTGIGELMIAAAEKRAMALGVGTIFLLTTKADRYFATRGYVETPKEDVPAIIKKTDEFRILSPGTAVCMSRELRSGA